MAISPRFEGRLDELQIPYATAAPVCSTLLDGVAQLSIKPSSTEQATDLLALLAEEGLPYHVLGSGSNTLITGTQDSPLRTPVISTKYLRGVDRSGDRITVGAGTPIALAAKFAGRQALTGLEFARDIPGTTAGAIATDAWHPIHNYAAGFAAAGLDHISFNKYISAVLASATLVRPDGEMVVMTPAELGMANRRSRLLDSGNDLLLVDATFGLEPSEYSSIFGAMGVICTGRKEMRDRNKAANPHSVGRTLGYSFVLNHASYRGKTAAQIIAETEALPEVIEIDGMHHSQQTPNIIANTGDGTAEGYLRIADRIRTTVADEHGIELPLEVTIVR